MPYYGSAYKGCAGVYDLSKLQAFDDPYHALDYANKKWNSIPDNDIARLLVVVTDDYESNTHGMAFFQFTDSAACKKFIDGNKSIKWSNLDAQMWNGNAKLMG